MQIREPKYSEITGCSNLVFEQWGSASADRCRDQMVAYFRGGIYAPTFCVGDIGVGIVGFAAFAPSMAMNGMYELIWLVVHPQYRRHMVGTALTQWRLDEIKRLGGSAVQLVTQKPKFFGRFGFAPLAPLGNDWTLMLKRLKNADMG